MNGSIVGYKYYVVPWCRTAALVRDASARIASNLVGLVRMYLLQAGTQKAPEILTVWLLS